MVSQTKSRKIPTRDILPLFFVIRLVDAECSRCSACAAGVEYVAAPCSKLKDISCVTIRVCNATEYVSHSQKER